jgi:hypothetical protein
MEKDHSPFVTPTPTPYPDTLPTSIVPSLWENTLSIPRLRGNGTNTTIIGNAATFGQNTMQSELDQITAINWSAERNRAKLWTEQEIREILPLRIYAQMEDDIWKRIQHWHPEFLLPRYLRIHLVHGCLSDVMEKWQSILAIRAGKRAENFQWLFASVVELVKRAIKTQRHKEWANMTEAVQIEGSGSIQHQIDSANLRDVAHSEVQTSVFEPPGLFDASTMIERPSQKSYSQELPVGLKTGSMPSQDEELPTSRPHRGSCNDIKPNKLELDAKLNLEPRSVGLRTTLPESVYDIKQKFPMTTTKHHAVHQPCSTEQKNAESDLMFMFHYDGGCLLKNIDELCDGHKGIINLKSINEQLVFDMVRSYFSLIKVKLSLRYEGHRLHGCFVDRGCSFMHLSRAPYVQKESVVEFDVHGMPVVVID